MKRLVMVLVAVGALCASPAMAQTAEPTARARQLAERYVEMMDVPRMMREQQAAQETMMVEYFSALAALMTKAPAAEAAPIQSFTPEQDPALMAPMAAIMEEVMVEAVARTYTEVELQALVRFYDTDVGRSIMARDTALNLMVSRMMVERLDDLFAAFGMDPRAMLGGLQGQADNAPTRSMTPQQPSSQWPARSPYGGPVMVIGSG